MSNTILNYLKKDNKLNYIFIFVIIIMMILVIYYMYNTEIPQNNNHELVEGFRNNLKDLVDGGRRRRQEKFNSKQDKKTEISKLFNRLSKTEHFYDKNDKSMDHFKSKIKEYYRSFDKEKFTDVPKNSRLSLEKFQYFKQAFWDIFKD